MKMSIKNEEYLSDFLKYIKLQNLSAGTARTRRVYLTVFLKWLGDKSILDVCRDDVKDFIIQNKEKKDWKPNTYSMHIQSLKLFFDYLVLEELIEEKNNPIKKIKKPKVSSKDMAVRPLTIEELRHTLKVLNAPCTSLLQKVIFHILLSSGMRASELIKIRKYNIDFKESLIFLEREDTKGKIMSRLVPISPTAIELIKSYLISSPNNADYLFIHKDDKLLTYNQVYDAVSDVLSRAFPYPEQFKRPYGPHLLRHTFMTLWAEANGDPNAMRTIGGWTTFNQVNRYVHTSKQFLSSEVKKAGKKLWKVME